jgi:protein TonB
MIAAAYRPGVCGPVFVEANPEKRPERLASAAAVAAFHGLIGYALMTGLGIDIAREASGRLKLFDIRRAPPPPSTHPPPAAVEAQAQAAAAPPAPKAEASPVVAPAPEVRLPVPPPLPAALKAGTGSEASQGASILGTGTGAGGEGSGSGSGDSGSGSGSGGAVTRARQIGGALFGRDFPRAAKRARAGGTVLVRYTVGADGRVSGCTITQSSGNADLDSTTCDLIEKRFRYEPARDAQGNPVPDVQTGRHIWWTEPRRRQYPYEWKPEEAPID